MRRAIPAPIVRRIQGLIRFAYWLRWRFRVLAGKRAALPAGALDCVVAGNKHGVYCVPRSSRHRPAAQAILQSRVWEPDTLDLVGGTDRDGDIVHAETFFGDFLPALARSRRNGGVVWAFEPNRESFRCAQITMLLNDLGNVELTHAALDAKTGSALLATSNRAGVSLGGGSRIIKDPSTIRDPSKVPHWSTKEEVELISVDEVVGEDRRVAVIQLDVEGHERQALTGAMRTIERCRPLLVLESLPDASWIAANLAPLGYQRDGWVHANAVLRCR